MSIRFCATCGAILVLSGAVEHHCTPHAAARAIPATQAWRRLRDEHPHGH
jgi:hypothetical protein